MFGLRESETALRCMTVFALSCQALQMVSCQNKLRISGLQKKIKSELCHFRDKYFQVGVKNFFKIRLNS